MRMDPISLYDYEARARHILPHNNWVFVEAGAMDERTTARNRTAFEALTLRPRFLRDTTERKIATTVLGTDISFPVMISPTDSHLNAHPEAERATARGAGMSGTLMMCSTSSNCSMEEIAEAATGPLWFQLSHRGHDLSENLVKRAEAAGFKAIVLTVDAPIPTPKERDIRNRYERPGRVRQLPRTGKPRRCRDRRRPANHRPGTCRNARPSPGASSSGCGASPICRWC